MMIDEKELTFSDYAFIGIEYNRAKEFFSKEDKKGKKKDYEKIQFKTLCLLKEKALRLAIEGGDFSALKIIENMFPQSSLQEKESENLNKNILAEIFNKLNK